VGDGRSSTEKRALFELKQAFVDARMKTNIRDSGPLQFAQWLLGLSVVP